MKNRNIGFGAFIISVGILWLLINTGIITWDIFGSLITLWPLILVVIGLDIVFRHNPIVKLITWLAFLLILIVYGYYNGGTPWHNRYQTIVPGNEMVWEKSSETKYGEVDINLGGTELNVGSDTGSLARVVSNIPNLQNNINYRNGKETAVIDFTRKIYSPLDGSRANNSFNLKLNADILWNMEINTGAVKGEIDLSDLKISDLDINAGAGRLNITLGDGSNITNVKVNAGASSLDMNIPEKTAVRIKMDGALNKTNFSQAGLVKSGNYYTSPNYNDARNKVDMDVVMGVGEFNLYFSK